MGLIKSFQLFKTWLISLTYLLVNWLALFWVTAVNFRVGLDVQLVQILKLVACVECLTVLVWGRSTFDLVLAVELYGFSFEDGAAQVHFGIGG